MKRTWSALLSGAVLVLASATASQAQIAITPLVGGYIPASDLKAVQSGATTVAIDREGTLALGANLELGILRASLAYASGTTIKDANKADIGKGTVLAAAADIVIRPLPRILVQPYLLGGVGIKNLSYDKDAGIGDSFPEDDSELAIHAGVGADLMLGPIGVVLELTDFVSKDADNKFKVHDAFLMAGLKLKLGGK